jgi:VanZ family protein
MFFLVYWLPPLVLAGIIFKLSSGTVPKTSDIYWQDFAVKKLAHVTFYGLLAILVYRALIAGGIPTKKAVIMAIIISAFYGGTDELHQHFTQGRESRLRDVGFDGIGATIAMYFTTKILPRMPKEVVEFGKRFELI